MSPRCDTFHSSWPGLSRPSTSYPPRVSKDVDARHKAGHDGVLSSRSNCRPHNWLLDDRQVDQRGRYPEEDTRPPDHIIGAGLLVKKTAQIDAKRAADLMAEEGDS